jgi:hypothetical protein
VVKEKGSPVQFRTWAPAALPRSLAVLLYRHALWGGASYPVSLQQLAILMEAFDSINGAFTPRQVAKEWRASLNRSTPAAKSIALSNPQTVSFENRLRTIVKCYERLCALLPAQGPDVHPVYSMFDDALSQVASMESGVSSVLALRGEQAMTMLEALQTVRASRSFRTAAAHLGLSTCTSFLSTTRDVAAPSTFLSSSRTVAGSSRDRSSSGRLRFSRVPTPYLVALETCTRGFSRARLWL